MYTLLLFALLCLLDVVLTECRAAWPGEPLLPAARSAHCPPTHPHAYGGGSTTGGFCCPVKSSDNEHCPGSKECCLSPIPGSVGCEGVARCGRRPFWCMVSHVRPEPVLTKHSFISNDSTTTAACCRCGNNPSSKPACPPPKPTPRVPPAGEQLAPAPPPGAERCSVPSDRCGR